MITQTNFQGPDSDPADIKNEMSPQTNLHAPSFEEEEFDIHQVPLPVLCPEDEKVGLQQMMAQYGQQPAGYTEYYEGGGQQQWLGEYQSHQLSYNYNQSYGQQQQQQQQHYYSQQQQQYQQQQQQMYPGSREELYPGLPPGRSPSGSHSTPSPHSQGQEGSQEDPHIHHQFTDLKRPHADAFRHDSMSHSQNVVRKPKVSRRKKKRDPNEPQKPVSAYALFFRDSQASIKGRNPNMSFGDVSKCVASLWDALDPDSKAMYKKRTEMAKKEYLRQLASYRATLVSNGQGDEIYGFPGYGYPSLGLGQSIPPHPPGPPVLPHQAYGSPSEFQLNHQAGAPHGPRPDISPEGGLPPSPPSGPPGPAQPDTEFPHHQQAFPPHHDRNHNSPCYHRVPGQCGRPGCTNPVTKASDGTESTYCSSECVVGQCREVYTSWSSHHQPGGRELPGGPQPRPAQVK